MKFNPISRIVIALVISYSASNLSAQGPGWQWARAAGSPTTEICGGNFSSSTNATDNAGNTYVTGSFKGSATFGTVSISSPLYPNVFIAKYDVAGNCVWVKQFGGDDADTYGNQGMAVDVDQQGNCYVTGTFRGSPGNTIVLGTSTLTGSGNRQIFIAKYDVSGNALWALQPSTTGSANNYARSIAVDGSGNCYVTGIVAGTSNTFGSTAALTGPGSFAVKCNASGTILWATKLATGSSDPGCIAVDVNGAGFITGSMTGTVNFATTPATQLITSGFQEVFVVKIDPAGSLTWAQKFSCTPAQNVIATPAAYSRGISIDGAGNAFLTGQFTTGMVIGSTTLTNSNAFGSEVLFVAKLDNNGNTLWALQSANSNTTMAGSTRCRGTAIRAGLNGECFLTGYYEANSSLSFGGIPFVGNGSSMSYVAKISAAGTVAWAEFANGTGSSAMSSGISLDSNGGIYISGSVGITAVFGSYTINTVNNSRDVFVAKLNGTPPVATGLKEIQTRADASVYPNPFQSSVTFDLNGSSATGAAALSLYNVLGQEVMQLEIPDTRSIIVERGTLPPGIYTYRLYHDGKLLQTGKLIAN